MRSASGNELSKTRDKPVTRTSLINDEQRITPRDLKTAESEFIPA
jgi:hypothetical protein